MKDGLEQSTILEDHVKNKLFRFAHSMVFPVFLLIIWQCLSSTGWLNSYLIPSPVRIFIAFMELLFDGLIFEHLEKSLIRLGAGMAITISIAVPLGVGLGLFSRMQKFITPTLTFLQQIPAIAWIPIFILWFGIDESSKIALIVYASFFPVFINTLFGIQSVDPKFKEVSEAFMLSTPASILRVYLPSAAPYIFIGVRLGFSNCWRALVAAEIIASSKGIGYLLMEGRDLAEPERIFVSIFVIGIMGTFIDLGVRRLEESLLPWYKM